MKVLWFTSTPSLYDQGKHHYNGCGWIESLEEVVRTHFEIELAIAFFHPSDSEKVIKSGICYYPILRPRARKNPFKAILNNWQGRIEQEDYQKKFLAVIEDFKPDIIQVFGTEGPFALIQELTPVPVLVHLQGLINPIINTYFPNRYSKLDFVFDPKYLFKNLIGTSPLFSYKRFKTQAEREKKIFSKLKLVCGRTEWDRQIAFLYNPEIQYFHIDEVLRPVFYQKNSLIRSHSTRKCIILSTLSPTVYKGIDVILKTAQKLKELTKIDFEWRIIGLSESSDLLRFFELKEGIKCKNVDIKLLGILSPDQLIQQLLEADVFVYPSYIDNSPNSVCEAQMLGLPVIACNVGGVSSIVKHNETGILIPSNGVYELVHYLNQLNADPELRNRLGRRAKEEAIQRHDREKIVQSLISVYKTIDSANQKQ